METWERLYATALISVVAIDQVLAFERRVRRLSGDAELARARRIFDENFPGAKRLRDIVAHLDDYAVGTGRRQANATPALNTAPPVLEKNTETFMFWHDDGGTFVRLGDDEMNLRDAAASVVRLAAITERARIKALQQASREADIALRRKYRLPPG